MENIYLIVKIDGDYATLRRQSDGEELFIAMALLPLGADIGSKLEYANLEFSLL